MLVIDDFNELVGLETLFRRLGFDVLSLGRESLVNEALLGFQPDLAIATGRGRHIDGLSLGPKLRLGTSRPKLAVLLPALAGSELQAERPEVSAAEVDAVIETPFDPRSALKTVAQLLGLEAEPILEKYERIVSARLFEPLELKIIKHPPEPVPMIHVTTGAGDAGASANTARAPEKKRMSAREARYAKYLDDKAEEELPPMISFDTMRDARKKLLAAEATAPMEATERAAKLAREKREFVRAMLEAGQTESKPTTPEKK